MVRIQVCKEEFKCAKRKCLWKRVRIRRHLRMNGLGKLASKTDIGIGMGASNEQEYEVGIFHGV
jgi:hypothetical protein